MGDDAGLRGIVVVQPPEGMQPERIKWHLSPNEQAIMKDVSSRPYITVHLYAGDPERNWFMHMKEAGCKKLVEMIAEAGFNVVLLGATSKRQEDEVIRILDETWSYGVGMKAKCGKQTVYNFTGSAHPRLQSAAVEKAAATIGTMSAWTTLGIAYRKPAWICTIEGIHHHFTKPDMGVFSVAGQYATRVQLDRTSTEEQLASVKEFLGKQVKA